MRYEIVSGGAQRRSQDTMRVVKGLYRRILPAAIRESAVVTRVKSRLVSHDLLYDAEYYANGVEGPAVRSAGTISASVMAAFGPRRIIDVGCGTGALLEAFRERGCEVFGLEYSDAALKYCRNRNLRVEKFDLERDTFGHGEESFDVAISMEVAEHLPKDIADRYIELLTGISPAIVFTAAQPGQGGTDHVNLQRPAYWIAKYRQRGFEYLATLSEQWRECWKAAGDVNTWYYENLMVFKRIE